VRAALILGLGLAALTAAPAAAWERRGWQLALAGRRAAAERAA
jgi:hypothetical protein